MSVILLTVTKAENVTVSPSENRGFTVSEIKKVVPFGSGSKVMYLVRGRELPYEVDQNPSEIAVLSGAPASNPSALAQSIVLVLDSANHSVVGTHNLVQLDGTEFTLPDNAIVKRSWREVQTTFTSPTADAATIALGIETDDVAGILAAIDIADGGNPWDAGLHENIQVGTTATMSVKTTATGRHIQAVIAVEAITAGIAAIVVEYVVTE